MVGVSYLNKFQIFKMNFFRCSTVIKRVKKIIIELNKKTKQYKDAIRISGARNVSRESVLPLAFNCHFC